MTPIHQHSPLSGIDPAVITSKINRVEASVITVATAIAQAISDQLEATPLQQVKKRSEKTNTGYKIIWELEISNDVYNTIRSNILSIHLMRDVVQNSLLNYDEKLEVATRVWAEVTETDPGEVRIAMRDLLSDYARSISLQPNSS